MKTIDLKEKNIPIIIFDDSLEKIDKEKYFQDKVDKANLMLKNIGLPKKKKV